MIATPTSSSSRLHHNNVPTITTLVSDEEYILPSATLQHITTSQLPSTQPLKSSRDQHFSRDIVSTKLPRLDDPLDDMPPLIREDQLSSDTPSSPIHFKKSTRSTTHPTAYYESTPILDFIDQASKYYQSH